MKRVTAILLFAALLLPFALPAFALGQDADAGVPICCRRNGAHHCAMSVGERAQMSANESAAGTSTWHAPRERCPFCPSTAPAFSHIDSLTRAASEVIFLPAFGKPTGLPQTESRRRIARDRSRQKRGPPAVSLA